MTPAPISVERLSPAISDYPGNHFEDAEPIMVATLDGEYVRHSEYVALLHQLAERDAECERLREELDVANTSLGQATTDCVEQSFRAEAAERAREALGQSIRDAQAAVCTSMAAFNMTGAVFVADPKLAERMAADSLLWQARAARAHAIPSISNCLEYGRTFLQRSHLRSVRNLSLLIAAGQNTVIEDLLSKLSPNEKAPCYEIIKAWITEDSSALRIAGAEWEKYKEWINREEPDDFAGCYFFDGGISGKGLQLRLETRVCKNAK